MIAFPRGAATEMVIDGENGFLVADETAMAAAVKRLESIDPVRCRTSVAERYDVSITEAGYERVYRTAINAAHRRDASRPTGGMSPGRRLDVSPIGAS